MNISIFLNLLIIGVVLVYGLDYSGFVEEIERYLTVFLRSRIPLKIPKPLSCSRCMTFYTGLIYLIIVNSLSFNSLFILSLISASTPVILHLLNSFIDFLNRLIDWFDWLTGLYR